MEENKKSENPPAFAAMSATQYYSCVQEGMSLRDYFAAKAMNGMNILAWKTEDYSILIERAYLLADAMLKQREL